MSEPRFFQNDEQYRADLRRPFEPEQIEMLPKAGMQLAFVSHANVTDRLNNVAPDWSYTVEPVVVERDGVPHVIAVTGTMTIGGKTLMEAGEVDRPSNYGDEYKRGISDFIRRGAMRFGVGIDLWIKGEAASYEVEAGAGAPAVGNLSTGTNPEPLKAQEPGGSPASTNLFPDVTEPPPPHSVPRHRYLGNAQIAEPCRVVNCGLQKENEVHR